MPKSTIRLIVLSATVGAVAASPLLARSAEWYAKGNASQQVSYDDNIGLQSDSSDQVSAFGETSTIEMSAGGRSPTAEIDFSSVFDFTRFPTERSLNSNDQFLTLSALKRGQRWTARMVGDFIRDTTRTSDVEDTGEFILQNRRREVLRAGPEVTYQLTPVDELGFGGRFSDTHYPSNNLRDFEQWGGTGNWVHSLSERTQVLLLASGFRVNSGSRGSLNSNYYSAQVGAAHVFSDRLSARLTAGPTIADTDETSVSGGNRNSQSDISLGYGFDGSVDYRLQERLLFSGSVFRTVTPSDTTGTIAERTGFRFNSTYDLFKNVYFDTEALYQFRETIGQSTNTPRRDFISFRPSIRWQFLDEWTMRLGYRLRWQHLDRDNNDDAFSNTVLASVTYGFPPLTMAR